MPSALRLSLIYIWEPWILIKRGRKRRAVKKLFPSKL
jgi:hypothetical protein